MRRPSITALRLAHHLLGTDPRDELSPIEKKVMGQIMTSIRIHQRMLCFVYATLRIHADELTYGKISPYSIQREFGDRYVFLTDDEVLQTRFDYAEEISSTFDMEVLLEMENTILEDFSEKDLWRNCINEKEMTSCVLKISQIARQARTDKRKMITYRATMVSLVASPFVALSIAFFLS